MRLDYTLSCDEINAGYEEDGRHGPWLDDDQRAAREKWWAQEERWTDAGRLRHELAEAKLTVERAGRMCAVAERSLGAARLKQAEAEQALAAAEQEKK